MKKKNNITRKNLEKELRRQPKLLGRMLGKLWLQHLSSSSGEVLLDNDLVPLGAEEFWQTVSDQLVNPQEVRTLLWELSGYMGDECYHPNGLHLIREAEGWRCMKIE